MASLKPLGTIFYCNGGGVLEGPNLVASHSAMSNIGTDELAILKQ